VARRFKIVIRDVEGVPRFVLYYGANREFEVTDAHCHVSCGDANVRELLIGRDFFGVHPWEGLGGLDGLGGLEGVLSTLNVQLSTSPRAGVGEIGLDRLKVRDIPPLMRELFEVQLKLAIELKRPVVLHGAKCWGQVVREVKSKSEKGESKDGQTFLFHGFSRSDGLIPDIVALNGFISVGPAVLNDHAVNYRELVKKIPLERLLVETDRTEANAAECPSVAEVLAKTAELRGLSAAELEAITDENAEMFLGGI